MMYNARILADSISPAGDRLTTLEVTWPHAVHKDFMTHRAFSRNFQSFRACPPEENIRRIESGEGLFVPEAFGSRVKGMGQGEAIAEQEEARAIWLEHVNHALWAAKEFLKLDIAKEQTNFLLQDLTSITGIVTATEWDNFWALRAKADNVRPEVNKTAVLMHKAWQESQPTEVEYGDWHLPMVDKATEDPMRHNWKKLSVGRCARVSYLTHDGRRDQDADARLHDQLMANGHMSPFEHVATPMCPGLDCSAAWFNPKSREWIQPHAKHGRWSGNFRGWHQYRKDIPNEANYGALTAE